MKIKLIFTVTLLLLTNAASAQTKRNNMKNKDILYAPVITPEFETFDTIRYQKIKEEGEPYGSEILPDGVEIFMTKGDNYYAYNEIHPSSYFFIRKVYYLNNNIWAKGAAFNYEDFRKGIWYFYDESGNLTETIDYDKPFKFTFEKVMEFCKKEGIHFKPGDVEWGVEVYLPAIKREYIAEFNECWWEIRWLNRKLGKVETIRLDGVTGKEISRKYMDYIR